MALHGSPNDRNVSTVNPQGPAETTETEAERKMIMAKMTPMSMPKKMPMKMPKMPMKPSKSKG